MQHKHHLQVVIALCFWAVAAPATFADGVDSYANPQQVGVVYDGQPTTVTVDGNCAQAHPEQVTNQANDVVTRGRVGTLEERVDEHDRMLDEHSGRIVDLEREPRVLVVGQLVATAPYRAPGGQATKQPVLPAKEGAMSIEQFGGFLLVGGIVTCLILIVVALNNRNSGSVNTLPNYQTALPLFRGGFRGFYAGADGSAASYVGTLVGDPAQPAAPALPAATPTNLQRAQAQAALAAFAPPLADPAGTNLQVLTQAMVANNIDGSVPALVTQQLALLVGTGQVS